MNLVLISFIVLLRIFSNSLANVYQKRLVQMGLNPFFINFIMYSGLSICCFPFLLKTISSGFVMSFWLFSLFGGLFGALGNGFLVKALDKGELSVLGPINAYKSVVAMIFGILLLKEIPSVVGILGVVLIIVGSYFVFETQKEGFSIRLLARQDIRYRLLALIFTAIEAVFIKEVIVMSDAAVSFVMWCFFGMLFSGIAQVGRPVLFPKEKYSLTIILNLLAVIILMGVMQLSTNFVFSQINVSYGLALFQLSVILNVVLGWHYFREGQIRKKLVGSFIMVVGACVLIILG